MDGDVRITAVGVPKQGGPPPQAGQHLDGVDPEAGADKEARDVLAAADICIAQSVRTHLRSRHYGGRSIPISKLLPPSFPPFFPNNCLESSS